MTMIKIAGINVLLQVTREFFLHRGTEIRSLTKDERCFVAEKGASTHRTAAATGSMLVLFRFPFESLYLSHSSCCGDMSKSN
jgi:hypothetical protein